MKKWRLPIIIFLILLSFVAGTYIFIPAKLIISNNHVINGTLLSTNRIITDSNQWKKWWPGSPSNNQPLVYNGYTYKVVRGLYNEVEVKLTNQTKNINSRFTFLPINKDSIVIDWRCEMNTRSLPWERISDNSQGSALKEDMQHLFGLLKNYIENPQNVYGIPVVKTKVKDTLLIVTKANFLYIPSTEETYKLINILKTHAMIEKVPQTGSPMVHVLPVNPGYEVMVALPVGKAPAENERVTIRRMVPGNILVAEVKGGPWTISQAYRQMENYVYDHRYESPAKPFQSLVTKRDIEKDTAQWITRIYYPIF